MTPVQPSPAATFTLPVTASTGVGFLSKLALLYVVLRSPMPSSHSPSFVTFPFLTVLQVFNHHLGIVSSTVAHQPQAL